STSVWQRASVRYRESGCPLSDNLDMPLEAQLNGGYEGKPRNVSSTAKTKWPGAPLRDRNTPAVSHPSPQGLGKNSFLLPFRCCAGTRTARSRRRLLHHPGYPGRSAECDQGTGPEQGPPEST